MLGSNPVLAVRDLTTSAAWYARVLGCTVNEPDPGNWAFCKTGAVTFMLGRCPDALPATELGDHSYVAYLTVTDVDAFHREEPQVLVLEQVAEFHEVRVAEPLQRTKLALQIEQTFRVRSEQCLQSHRRFEKAVVRLVDHAHSADAERSSNDESTILQLGTRFEKCGRFGRWAR